MGNLLLANLPSGSSIEYVVDANNRRIAKKVDGDVVKRWLYSGELTPIAELDSVGNVAARFVYATKSNTPDYFVKGDTTYKIISDHLGSVRLIINVASGEIKQQIKYDEFGYALLNNGTLLLPFGYAGGLTDAQTGLVRFGARDYSATTGRWTAKDPIDFDGGDLNLYGYVVNDPINMIDEYGTTGTLAGNQQWALLGLGGALVAGAASQANAIGDAFTSDYFNLMSFAVTATLVTNLYFGTWRGDYSNPDDDSGIGGNQKMPGGNNKHFNKMAKEALKILGLKNSNDAAEKLHRLITGKGLRTLKEIIDYVKSHGL